MLNSIITFFTSLLVSVTTFFGGTATTTDTLIMRVVLEPNVAPKVTLAESLRGTKTSFVTLASDGKATVTVPQGASYALIKAWGGAGGSFGNDNYNGVTCVKFSSTGGRGGARCAEYKSNSIFAVLGLPSNNTPGGHGGFVSGKLSVVENQQISAVLGLAGYSGYRKGDNNDVPGGPGTATRVMFNGAEIMVAGAGAEFSNTAYNPDGTKTYINDTSEKPTNKTPEVLMEELRQEFSNGGSPASKRGSEYLDFSNPLVKKSNLAGTRSIDGKPAGLWMHREVPSEYVVAGLSGGGSWVASSIQDPVYYSGDPDKNTLDNHAWKDFLFKSANQFGAIGAGRAGCCYTAGSGALVVEFYTSTTTVSTPPDLVENPVPYLGLKATLDGQDINGVTNVAKDSDVKLAWTFGNVSDKSTCSLSKLSSGGTAFNTVNGSVLETTSSIQTTTLSPASYVYELRCQNPALSSKVSFTVTNGGVCENGAVDYPLCTLVGSNTDDGGGDTTTDNPNPNPGIGGIAQTLVLPATDTINVKYLGGRNGVSEKKKVSLGVFPSAPSLTHQPQLLISSLPVLPEDTTMTCSINGGEFDECKTGLLVTMSPDGFGGYVTNLQISISKKLTGDPENHFIKLSAQSGVLLSNTMKLKILQDVKNPNFTEF